MTVNYGALTDEELARFAIDDAPGAREAAANRLAEVAADPYCADAYCEGLEHARQEIKDVHHPARAVLERLLKEVGLADAERAVLERLLAMLKGDNDGE